MFGLFRKRSNPVRDAVQTAKEFAEALIQHFGPEPFRDDPKAPQALTAYVFGGICVLAKEGGLKMPEMQTVTIAFLNQYCGFPEERCVVLSGELLGAMADRDPASGTYWLYQTAHRGMDGFVAWRDGKPKAAGRDFVALVADLNAAG